MQNEFAILAGVAAHPSYVYDLLDHLQELGIRAAQSTFYRRIEGLVARGFLEATDVRTPNGAHRKNLQLTESGRRRVAHEATRVLRTEPLESPFFALALGCTHITDAERLPAILRPRMAKVARSLSDEKRSLHAESDGSEYWSRIVRQRRIAHLEADVTWLQAVVGRRPPDAETEPTVDIDASA